jgi:formate--tetrahydrofolate ligase
VCMAKTQYSLSADASLLNVPRDFEIPIRDIRAYTGAGWLVPLCGDIQQMPGLSKTAAVYDVDIDQNGQTVGLF